MGFICLLPVVERCDGYGYNRVRARQLCAVSKGRFPLSLSNHHQVRRPSARKETRIAARRFLFALLFLGTTTQIHRRNSQSHQSGSSEARFTHTVWSNFCQQTETDLTSLANREFATILVRVPASHPHPNETTAVTHITHVHASSSLTTCLMQRGWSQKTCWEWMRRASVKALGGSSRWLHGLLPLLMNGRKPSRGLSDWENKKQSQPSLFQRSSTLRAFLGVLTCTQRWIYRFRQHELPFKIQLSKEHVAASARVFFWRVRQHRATYRHAFVVDDRDKARLSDGIATDGDRASVQVCQIALKTQQRFRERDGKRLVERGASSSELTFRASGAAIMNGIHASVRYAVLMYPKTCETTYLTLTITSPASYSGASSASPSITTSTPSSAPLSRSTSTDAVS